MKISLQQIMMHIICSFVVSNYILSGLLHHAVESYVLNPKAIHPNGRLPSIAKARRMASVIKQEIENSKDTIILVDGNNIRNSFGYENMSAVQLTDLMSSWSVDSGSAAVRPQIICFWDGGGTICKSQKVLSSSTSTLQLAVYSGPDSNADDVMVQCCAFITSKGCSRDDKQYTTNKKNIVVFTSDANLANRCQMQLEMGNSDTSNSGKTKHQTYHSIHLCLLLLGRDDNEVIINTNDQLAPDWDRSERRRSVDDLQTYLDNSHDKPRVDDGLYNTLRCIGSIHEWINRGLSGIEIGRVTKGGSILYEIR